MLPQRDLRAARALRNDGRVPVIAGVSNPGLAKLARLRAAVVRDGRRRLSILVGNDMGATKWPPYPQRSSRPGEPGTLLDPPSWPRRGPR